MGGFHKATSIVRASVLVSVICCAMASILPTRPAAAAEKTRTYLVQQVRAKWIVSDADSTHSLFFLEAEQRRSTEGGATHLRAVMGRGICEPGVGGFSCQVIRRVNTRRIRFEIDASLSSAVVVLRYKGKNHEVRWTSSAPPQIYEYGESCGGSGGIGQGLFRSASAAGNLFDRSLKDDSNTSSAHWMLTMLLATDC